MKVIARAIARELGRSVEVGAPILNHRLQQLLRDYFDIQWRDNVKARRIAPPLRQLLCPEDQG